MNVNIFENNEEIIARVHDSACIKDFTYNKLSKTLSVTFTHSRTYDYPGIDESIVREWMGAESAGKYFNKEIRYGYANYARY